MLPNVTDPQAAYTHIPEDPAFWLASLNLQMTIDGQDAPSDQRSTDLALQMANDTTYGLGGSIWTNDIDRGIALAERLEVGTAWVNQHGAFTAALPMPFAKESGIDIDYAEYGLAEHTRHMLVNARL